MVAITIEGCRIDGAVTSQGAGCCVAMVTANGPGHPLREYIRPSATSGLEILLNFICDPFSRAFFLCLAVSFSISLSLSLRCFFILSRLPRGRASREKSRDEEASGMRKGIEQRRRVIKSAAVAQGVSGSNGRSSRVDTPAVVRDENYEKLVSYSLSLSFA